MSEEKNEDIVLEDVVEDKPKSGVSVVKLTVIAAIVTMVISGGYVFLSGSSDGGVVIDQPTAVVQQPSPQVVPMSPNGGQESSDSFDLMASAISEKSGGGSLPSEINTDVNSPSAIVPSASAEYVDIDRYNKLLDEFNSMRGRLESLESGGVSVGGASSENLNVENRLKSLEGRVVKIESFINDSADAIAAMNDIVEQNKKSAFERDGNVRSDVPLSAKGRSRLVGYQYSMGTENKDVSIVVNDAGIMTVLTNGVVVEYGGKKLPVTKVISSEDIILVGDDYFVDKIKGVGPKSSSVAKQSSAKLSSGQDKLVKSNVPAKIRNVSGWKILALTPDMNGGLEATIELPSGKLITLVRGESTKVYGKVNRIDDSGVYFDGYKINTSGR